tara:strand:+ start:72 stop:1892 length:1821 start_codon:yes stop_codon:yes gene_type:complete
MLDGEETRISCEAFGYEEGAQLTWTSDASWAYGAGDSWEFTIHEELLGPIAQVVLDECWAERCQIVETLVDTSMLITAETATPSSDDSSTTSLVQPSSGLDLLVECVLVEDERKISCTAVGADDEGQLRWTSTATSSVGSGSSWDFSLGGGLVSHEVSVLLEKCAGTNCEFLDQLFLDTSMVGRAPILVDCVLAQDEWKISCTAEGAHDEGQLRWTSTATSSVGSGSSWDFSLGEGPVPQEVPVLLEECAGTNCEMLTQKHVDTDRGRTSVMRRACMNGFDHPGPVTFANSPMRFEDIGKLMPYGVMIMGHVTPIDHMYLYPKDFSLGRDAYEVRAIQDGVIFELQPRDTFTDTNTPIPRQWRMEIVHSCTFTSYFDLLTSIHPDLEAAWTSAERLPPGGYPVSAGQVIGWVGAQSLDFGVYDWEVVLPGFVEPSHYEAEPWKIHTVDPFPYFPAEVTEALLEKMERTVEPRAGKIDYDIDGRLVGNWFVKDTGWYAGVEGSWRTWDGHLAIAPDWNDPNEWWFSIGNYEGEYAQLHLLGDQPDPREVSVDSGMVTYLLTPSTTNDSDGVALVEMIGDRTVKVEVFPGLAPDEVVGFTDAVRVYER